jgi:hypothetical protein
MSVLPAIPLRPPGLSLESDMTLDLGRELGNGNQQLPPLFFLFFF